MGQPTDVLTNPANSFRLRESLCLVRGESGILIDGLPRLEVIRGVLSDTLLHVLLDELKHPHTRESLRELFPEVPSESFDEVLAGLRQWGLLELVDADGVPSTPATRMVERWALAARQDEQEAPPPLGIWLTQSSVEIRSASPETAWMATLLKEHLEPLGCEVRHFPADVFLASESFGQLASVRLSGPGMAAGENASDATAEFFLGIGSSSHEMRIGPVLRGSMLCRQCVEKAVRGTAVASTIAEQHQRTGAALCSWEILDLLLRRPGMLGRERLREYDLTTCDSKLLFIPSHTLVCAENDHPTVEISIDAASQFNDRVSDELSASELTWNMTSQRRHADGTEFTASPRISLPTESLTLDADAGSLLAKPGRSYGGSLNLTQLAYLLGIAVGPRPGRPGRWTPTAGNLGSPRVHLLALQVDGLQGGLYTYDSSTHSLVDRRCPDSQAAEKIAQTLLQRKDDLGDFALILTGRRDVLARKYRQFSYKLAALDGGVLTAQLVLLASALGCGLHVQNGWPDSLLRQQLHLDRDAESVTGVLTHGRPKSLKRWFSSAPKFSGDPSITVRASLSRDSLQENVEFLLAGDAMDADVGAKRSARASEVPPLAASLVRLPWSARTAMPVVDVLHARSSVRVFSPEEVPMDRVAAVLQSAHRQDVSEWEAQHRRGISLRFTVVHAPSHSAQANIFRYQDTYDSLSPTMPGTVPLKQMEPCFVQPEFASAPLTILISAPLSFAVEQHGLAAYRLLLARAAAAAYRMWLMGIALGLEGAIHAGLRTFPLRQMLPSLAGEGVLFACSLGIANEN